MPNPVLVEIYRNGILESFHRAAVIVMNADGETILQLGDCNTPVFPRSAVKAIQALPLVESGAADTFGLGEREIAIACSSHSGQPAHIDVVRQMLKSAGVSEDNLECGGHWSFVPAVLREQAGLFSDKPSAIWNNCSGKHAGFLCTAAHLGWQLSNYTSREHAIQQEVRNVLESVTGSIHGLDVCGTDGCSIPTYAISLKAMALGFARMATGNGLEPQRAIAAKRILNACMNQPFFTAGDQRFCTKLMELGQGRIFGKTGAEGVYCAAIPELGFGIAIKCDDGATRGSEAITAATLSHVMPVDNPLKNQLKSLANYSLQNWMGRNVGAVKTRLIQD